MTGRPATAPDRPADPRTDPPADVPADVPADPPADAPPGPPAAPLRELASAVWPEHPEDTLPAIAGFVLSSFSPLVAETAERCLRRYYGAPPAAGPRTALLLASEGGDLGTADALAAAVASGARVPPLLFFQSNPNAVLGHLAARWALDGPVVALGPGTTGELLDHAALLVETGEADQVLAVTADQAPDRARAVLLALPPSALAPHENGNR